MTRIAFLTTTTQSEEETACIWLYAYFLNQRDYHTTIFKHETSDINFHPIPTISYLTQTTTEMNELLYKHGIKIFYILTTQATHINYPTIVPICLHSPTLPTINSNLIHYTPSQVKQIPHTSTLVKKLQKAGGMDPEISKFVTGYCEDIEKFFILPCLKMVTTLAFSYKNLITIFKGTDNPTDVTLLNLNEQMLYDTKKASNSSSSSTSNVSNTDIALCKYRVKFLCNWDNDIYTNHWSRMHLKESKIQNCNNEEPDYWVIINKPLPNMKFIPSRTIVFIMEPNAGSEEGFQNWLSAVGLKKKDFLYYHDHEHFRNNTEWHLSLTGEELLFNSPLKVTDDIISTVVSSQYEMEGHKLRIDFTSYYQAHGQYPLMVYGKDNKHNLKNYQGSLPWTKKDKGILPYKYAFAGENSSTKNYITEKLIDCILGETLCFYWGCENVDDFHDERSYIRVDLKNPAEATTVIDNAIKNDEWGKRIDFIRKEKYKIIKHMNIFSRVEALLDISKMHIVSTSSPVIGLSNIHNSSDIPDVSTKKILETIQSNKYHKLTFMQVKEYMFHVKLWMQCFQANKPFIVITGEPKAFLLDYMTIALSAIKTMQDINILVIDPIRDSKEPDVTQHIKSYILWPDGAAKLLSYVKSYKDIVCVDEMIMGDYL